MLTQSSGRANWADLERYHWAKGRQWLVVLAAKWADLERYNWAKGRQWLVVLAAGTGSGRILVFFLIHSIFPTILPFIWSTSR